MFPEMGAAEPVAEAAIQQDALVAIPPPPPPPRQLHPGHPPACLLVHNPKSSLWKDQTHILTPDWPLHIFLGIKKNFILVINLLPAACIHLKEGQRIMAVDGQRKSRHSEEDAVPLGLAGPRLKRSKCR